jgi:sialic acid synthase SpsE
MILIDQANHAVVIGEVVQVHDGSLGMAHAFIDAVSGSHP